MLTFPYGGIISTTFGVLIVHSRYILTISSYTAGSTTPTDDFDALSQEGNEIIN